MSARAEATLSLVDVQAHRGGRPLSGPITVECGPGTVLGVIGPNGAGKSSLLGALARTGVAMTGSVAYDERDLGRLRARERAAVLSFLAQDAAAPAELRVRELVDVGAGAWRSDGPETARARDEALDALDLTDIADRRVGTLSGGQLQLVQLARVLAQDAPVVLLDEPTSALDLGHQRLIEGTLARLARAGRVVLAALHDLDLVLNACTDALLLDGHGAWRHGDPVRVLTPTAIEDAYGVRTTIHTTPGGRHLLVPDDRPASEDPS